MNADRALLVDAFVRLNVTTLQRLLANADPSGAADDLVRGIASFACLTRGDGDGADAFLEALTNDGTLEPGDRVYIEAARLDAHGDFAGALELLLANRDAPGIHGQALRLRAADLLVRTDRFAEVEEVLAPHLEPPGNDQTLEAHLILYETLLRTNADKEQLVEHAALIDSLCERGFRLPRAETVVYYARLLDRFRIEALPPALLSSHASRVESYLGKDPQEILWLLAAGEKYKAPSAVRAAGRSYENAPFPWKEVEPEKAAYQFAAHEQHNAARLSLLTSIPEPAIHADASLWGPLLLESYLAGEWQEALSLLDRHGDEIAQLPSRDHAVVLRAVSLVRLGRTLEALAVVDGNEATFRNHADGSEAAAELLARNRQGGTPGLEEAYRRQVKVRQEDRDFLGSYLPAAANEFIYTEDEAALEALLALEAETLGEPGDAYMRRTLLVLLEWSYFNVVKGFMKQVDPETVLPTMALLAAFSGERDEAIRTLNRIDETTLAANDALAVARAARIVGAHRILENAVSRLCSLDKGVHRPLGMALGPQADAAVALREIPRVAPGPDVATALASMVRQLAHGDDAPGCLAAMKDVQRQDPDSTEVLRLARGALLRPGGDPALRGTAGGIRDQWRRENLPFDFLDPA